MRRLSPPLMYAGVVGVVLGLSQYHAEFIGEYDFTSSFRFAWAFFYIGVLCIVAYGLGLPDQPRTFRSRLPVALGAAALGAVGISVIQLFVGDALLPRFVVFGSAALVVPWFVAMSGLSMVGRSALEARDRVIVVGPTVVQQEVDGELRKNPERPAAVVARLSPSDAADLSGERQPLIELVASAGGTVLVLSGEAQLDERIVEQAAILHESGLRVRTLSLFYEEWLGKLPVADLGRVALFFDIGEVHRERYGRFKRVVDIVAGIVGSVALAIAFPVVLVGNAIANRGPLFFSQDRVGRGGQAFRMYKFRSMRPDQSGFTEWTSRDDPRVTSFGRMLRASHLDELPQVWNILKGDLSLVGPRPEQPRYVAELNAKLPFYSLRHIVRPGLTGWAQVKYGYAGDERDAIEKLQYDFHYLRRQSVTFDLRIIGRTIRSLLGGEGRGR